MIRQSRLNGADIAKFQLYDAVALLGSDQWHYLELSQEQTAQAKQWCDEDGIEFMASVFDRQRLAWCEELGVHRYKIASRTVTNDPDLCRTILDLGKETIISLGSWTGPGLPFGQSDQIRYLYCKAKYPALLSDLADFPDDFPRQGLSGYSDHTLGIEVCLLAVARGAAVLEKHLTLDKTRGRSTEKGHVGSMIPSELDSLRRTGGLMYRARRAMLAARGAAAT
jgi:sialic acid synthase SpsE